MTIFAGRLGWYPHWRDQMRVPDSGPSSGPSSGLMKFKLDIRYERNSKLPEVWQRVHLF